ncbi:MAG: hypothetical protein JSS66_02860 [Armatimonadetes bacterium]|nr:hypothetical protein [Armatimonadota bacterium]
MQNPVYETASYGRELVHGRSLWRVELFGQLRLRAPDGSRQTLRYQKVGKLLAYLAFFAQRSHERDLLACMLWPEADPGTAKKNLSQSLYELRRILEPTGSEGSVVGSDRLSLWVNPQFVDSDVRCFEAAIEHARKSAEGPERLAHLRSAVDLAHSPLLPDRDDEWVVPQRIRLEEEYAQATVCLVDGLCDEGRPKEGVLIGKRALAHFPLREDLNIAVMRALAKGGETAEAIRQFERLETLLQEELGVYPSTAAVEALEKLPEPLARKDEGPKPASTHAVVHIPDAEPKLEWRLRPRNGLGGFFGRQDQVRQLGAWLSPSGTEQERIVCLAGPAGVGKTRLGLEVCWNLRAEFEGRTTMASCEDSEYEGSLWSRLCRNLDVAPEPGRSERDAAVAVLAGEPSLIFVDAAEADPRSVYALLTDLHESAPECRVMVSSREAVLFEGARSLPIRPLPVPTEGCSVAEASASESVQLFVDSCRRVQPDFHLTGGNVRAVAELCRRLDGLPLALNLAAGRIGVASPAVMLGKVCEQATFLARRGSALSVRHGSLAAALDWTFQVLDLEERHVLSAASVFRGGFQEEALLDVTGLPEIATTLTRLVELHLVDLEPTDEGQRYSLLNTVQEFAFGKLGPDQAADLAVRHADHFTRWLGKLTSTDQIASHMAEIGVESANLHAVLDRAEASSGVSGLALRLAGLLKHYLERRGPWDAWLPPIEAVCNLEVAGASANDTVRALNCAASLRCYVGDYRAQADWSQRAAKVAKKAKEPTLSAIALNGLGVAYRALGEDALATEVYQRALDHCDPGVDPLLTGRIHLNVAGLLETGGQYEVSKRHYAEGLKLAVRGGDVRLRAACLEGMARVAAHLGSFDEALGTFDKVRDMSDREGDELSVARTLANMAWCIHVAGESRAAAALLLEATEIEAASGEPRNLTSNLLALGAVCLALREGSDAARLYGAAMLMVQEHGFALFGDEVQIATELGRGCGMKSAAEFERLKLEGARTSAEALVEHVKVRLDTDHGRAGHRRRRRSVV